MPSHRSGYVAQVGLDFGTAFTKCVVRDIGTSRARVLEKRGVKSAPPYLFPSAIGFDGTTLTLEPTGEDDLLPFGKMVLTELARGRETGPAFELWRRFFAHLPGTVSRKGAVTLLLAWRLGAILKRARKLAAEMMPGFGERADDQFFVNLCVPVDDMQEEAVPTAFRQVLALAWRFGDSAKVPSSMTFPDLQTWAAARPAADATGLCDVYPEIAANVQAFLKSGFARGYWGKPFFITDVGAGTVDQSFFILSPDLGRLTFLSGAVQPIGSSQIELRCAQKMAGLPVALGSVSRVCAAKEGRSALPPEFRSAYQSVIAELRSSVEEMSRQTALHGRWTPDQEEELLREEQFEETICMNAGGGLCEDPYRVAVRTAFKTGWRLTPGTIELPQPEDLLTTAGEALPAGWFRRLSVAYGLSFWMPELHEITLPRDVRPLPRNSREDRSWERGSGRCISCGKPAVPGDDYCYHHSA